MSIPKVTIVGRPNVGKSSMFNWLAGVRLAIVDDMAGVTRDRMNYLMHHDGRYFEIVDTGGIGINDVDDLDREIEEQIEFGLREAEVLLFVVDAHDGPTPLDEQIARRLRAIDKPVLLVANKCDGENWEIAAAEFSRLGLGMPIVVSAKNNRRKEDLLTGIVSALPPSTDAVAGDSVAPPEMKVAVVGRRNVGKSTFINSLIGQQRMIVSEVAGTTRDSIDVRFTLDDRSFVAIDTPGLRRGKAIRTDIDFYSDHRAHRSIRHADVVLLFFDCSSRISMVDRKLASYIEAQFKPCIFVVNKWDLMSEHMPTGRWAEYLRENFASMAHVPIAFVTGRSGRNIRKLLNHAQMLFKQSLERETTGRLNRLVRRAIEGRSIPGSPSARPRIYYATQVGIQPPTIVLKCNDPDAIRPDYRRYLLNCLRDELSFGEIPIRLVLEARESTTDGSADRALEERSPDDPILQGGRDRRRDRRDPGLEAAAWDAADDWTDEGVTEDGPAGELKEGADLSAEDWPENEDWEPVD